MYEENISTLSLSLSSSHSITGDDIKLSERLYIPQRKLRGFERGKIGPKDGNDFIGGNYYAILNMTSTLPQLFPNAQNVDFLTFLDVANLWGVDDETLDDGSEIRSSIGLGVEWFTPVGPLSFSLASPITKAQQIKQKHLDLTLVQLFNEITKIYFCVFLYFFNINTAYSNTSTVFIDIDFILNNSILGKQILLDLEN